MIYFSQRSLMYFPDTAHTTPAAAGLPQAEEVPLTTADGAHIHAWHVAPQDDKPVMLYFHGNGGSLKYRVARFQQADRRRHRPRRRSNIAAMAATTAAPSEQGLIADAEAGYAYAAAHYPVQQIVVWGESLGSGVAVALAAEKPVGRVILEAPFTSAVAVGEQPLLVSAGASTDEGSIPFR